MIPTFNSSYTLRSTLESVLAQDPGPEVMQIEVVDDHSTEDDPEDVVKEVGRGRVAFVRQKRNLGVPGNLNSCISLSRGRFVHILHSDDLVLPGFYEALGFALDEAPGCAAAFCRHDYLTAAGIQGSEPLADLAGVLEGAVSLLASEQRIMTPCMVVRRSVYEAIGGFDSRLRCAEDWEMWVRIAAHFPVWYDPAPLAVYRMHDNSNTGRHIRTGDDLKYTRRAMALFRPYLPQGTAEATLDLARSAYATSAIRMAERLKESGDMTGSLAQIREACLLDPSISTLKKAVRLFARHLFGGAHGP